MEGLAKLAEWFSLLQKLNHWKKNRKLVFEGGIVGLNEPKHVKGRKGEGSQFGRARQVVDASVPKWGLPEETQPAFLRTLVGSGPGTKQPLFIVFSFPGC